MSSGLSSSSLANLEMESGPWEFLIGTLDCSPGQNKRAVRSYWEMFWDWLLSLRCS